ncbi:Putative signal transducing protein [Lutibacter oricola]|uniref:Putative signal transducing protein n=1 Tax=Lutibacter oricola TaxID=762486 RepID=A0A1H2U0I5_9FLAO|nr:DUF2007 domain-containing protein [Lutibacter oricola]SDW49510.1 Putative signal transducing protein [Lutibacter oricola]
MENSKKTLITILDTSFIHKIQIAKSLLESKGITSYIFDENMTSIIGTAISEGYKLKVNHLDADLAITYLESLTEVEE